MSDVTTKEHRANSGKLRELLAAYAKAEDLINIGAYQRGANPTIDRALAQIEPINHLLRQGMDENIDAQQAVDEMQKIISAGGGI